VILRRWGGSAREVPTQVDLAHWRGLLEYEGGCTASEASPAITCISTSTAPFRTPVHARQVGSEKVITCPRLHAL